MLQQICNHLHNYFIKASHYDKYTISGGSISPLPTLKDGQRILIRGSDLNDGVYTYHNGGFLNDDDTGSVSLLDETFDGFICEMSVPRELSDLANEISDWNDKYKEVVSSPYESENVIGVYSYTKKSGGESYGSGEIGWQTVFSKRLNTWRKVSL